MIKSILGMEIQRQEVINYYQNTAAGSYDRWGGDTGAYHFGYFSSPHINIVGKEPEQIQKLHLASHVNMLCRSSKFVKPQKGELILDAGCGSGSMLPYLSETGAKVIGINITPEHLLKAQKRIERFGLTNASLLRADFGEIPLKSESVDKMLFFESLTHAPDQEKVLKEANRLLKKNGEITIIEPMLTQIRSFLDANTYFSVREIDKGMCLQVSSYPYIASILSNLGYALETVDITYHVLPSMELAAGSAEAHKKENATEDVFRHRSATVGYRDLTRDGKLKYVMIKARKQ